MALPASPDAERFEVSPTVSDHFSWLRTRLSVERTMMSWVRTATALIGFGFTIVQFFDRMRQMPGTASAYFPEAPRYLGLSLIFCGVGSGDFDLGIPPGASLPLEPKLHRNRGSDA